MDKRPIGMFDSGVGGLTVLKEFQKKFSNEDIIYYGDTKSFPYGNKSKESIINLSKKGIEFLLKKNVKVIIIACGTATSQALDEVSKLYNIPIFGIIYPTVSYIVNNNNFKKVGILGTHGTIKSKSFENNLLALNPSLQIISRACPLLAPIAEEGLTNSDIAKLTIHKYMKGLHDVDALILGCTHYPLFTNLFKKEVSEKTELINTGVILSNYLYNNLNKDLFNNSNNIGIIKVYLTDVECDFLNVASKILKTDISQINIFPVSA